MPRKALRMAWLRLHRWLGLALGAWLVLLGLSGSALVFYVELEPWFDARVAPRVAERPVSIEAVFQALQAAHPERHGGWRIELPAPGQALVTARYLKPQEREGRAFAPLLGTVDGNTNEVVASRFWGDTAMTWLYDLHYALLLDLPGRRAVALVGVALAVLLLGGLVLWWPAPGRWRQALAFKRGAGAQRRVYDLHKWSGLIALPLLLVLGITGSVLAWPQLHAPWVVGLLGEPAAQRQPLSRSDPGGARLPVDEVLARVRARFPQAQPRWIDVPGAADARAAYRLRVRWPGEVGERFPAGVVWVDARSGAVLAARTPAALRGADRFNQWLHPLHSGEAFGLAGRLVVCAAGLLPLALAVTGVMRWGHKRRALRVARGSPLDASRAHGRPGPDGGHNLKVMHRRAGGGGRGRHRTAAYAALARLQPRLRRCGCQRHRARQRTVLTVAER